MLLFAVFFDKNLVKYIFGIFKDSGLWILHLRIIILECWFLNIAPLECRFILKNGLTSCLQYWGRISRVEFYCRCSKEKMVGDWKTFAAEDKNDIMKNGTFPLEVRCHHCNSAYHFTKTEIQNLWFKLVFWTIVPMAVLYSTMGSYKKLYIKLTKINYGL